MRVGASERFPSRSRTLGLTVWISLTQSSQPPTWFEILEGHVLGDIHMEERIYETAAEAAEAIGVKYQTIINWIRSNRLKAERVPSTTGKNRWRVKHSDLVIARRGTMFEEPITQSQLSLDKQDPAKAGMGLTVVWPDENKSQPFNIELFQVTRR